MGRHQPLLYLQKVLQLVDYIFSALLPTDTVEAIEAVLTVFRRQLASRIDGIWEMRKQAKFLVAAACLQSADRALRRYFQRECKPYHPQAISESTVFYGLCLGHVLGVYTTWKEV